MIDFAHEEKLLFFALLAFGNIRNGADDARTFSLMPDVLEISEPMHLRPADLAASPLQPELDRIGLRIDWIECRLACRPKSFRIVGMHPLLDLLDRSLVSGNIENLLRARITRKHAVALIVLPPPELGCIHGNLQARLARVQVALTVAQQVLRRLPPGGP